jgi:hypothetical protein
MPQYSLGVVRGCRKGIEKNEGGWETGRKMESARERESELEFHYCI